MLTHAIARYFAKSLFLTNPVTIVHHVTALLLHVVYRVPRRATRILLIALRLLVRISKDKSLNDNDNFLLDSLPIDIRTVLGRFDLDPVVHEHLCCPVCFAIYLRPFPERCSHKTTQRSKPCDAPLWRARTIRGRLFTFPLRVYLYQDMKQWLARLLSCPGLEDIMQSMLKRATQGAPSVMSDIWDAPIIREILMEDKTRFVDAPDDETRLIFGLSADGFNPYQSKQAKQQVSVTAIYMYCLNLPPHLRYLPENIFLVGVIPGPTKPSTDQFNHFLEPLVRDLLNFWHSGVFYSRTAKYPHGRLVRCALGPLVCDLPAARQASGFGGYMSKYFCSVCKLLRDNINNINAEQWPDRSEEEHRADATTWKEAPTVKGREAVFKESSIRWSALLELKYWNPIRFTVIDSMHNHYLGLLKHHCHVLWGMSADAQDADDNDFLPQPPQEEIATAMDHLYSSSPARLEKCTRPVLRYLVSMLSIAHKKTTKPALIQALLAYVRAITYYLNWSY